MTKTETKELIESINKTEKLRSKYNTDNKTFLNKVTVAKFEQVLMDCNLDADLDKKLYYEENQKLYLYYCEDVHIATYLMKNKRGWITKPKKIIKK